MDRVFLQINLVVLQRAIPDRQRVHGQLQPRAQMFGGLSLSDAFGGGLKLAHRFNVELEDIGLDRIVEPHLHRPVLVIHAERFVIGGVFRHEIDPETTVFDIAVNLVGVRRAAPMFTSVATEPGQRTDTGAANVVGYIVGIILIFLAAIFIHKARQPKPRAKLAKDRLEAAHVTVGFDHRPADRVGHAVRFADRTIEQRDAVVSFQIGRVRQDQVCIGHHFRRIGIRIDDPRDHIVTVFIFVGQHLVHAAHVHRRVPRHIGHIHEKRVDLVRHARVRVRNHHMHQPVGRHRVFP